MRIRYKLYYGSHLPCIWQPANFSAPENGWFTGNSSCLFRMPTRWTPWSYGEPLFDKWPKISRVAWVMSPRNKWRYISLFPYILVFLVQLFFFGGGPPETWFKNHLFLPPPRVPPKCERSVKPFRRSPEVLSAWAHRCQTSNVMGESNGTPNGPNGPSRWWQLK